MGLIGSEIYSYRKRSNTLDIRHSTEELFRVKVLVKLTGIHFKLKLIVHYTWTIR